MAYAPTTISKAMGVDRRVVWATLTCVAVATGGFLFTASRHTDDDGPYLRWHPELQAGADGALSWRGLPPCKSSCRSAAASGMAPRRLQNVTVGILTHEPVALAESLATYAEFGLFDVVPEVLMYVNAPLTKILPVLAPYVERFGRPIGSLHAESPPGGTVFRVLGSDRGVNMGITAGMRELVEHASQPFLLFVERDFRLVEPVNCVVERLQEAVELMVRGQAHAARFRSRWQGGEPNSARDALQGREDLVISGGQAAHACCFHGWLTDEQLLSRFSGIFRRCGTQFCVSTEHCHWTNNPVLFNRAWFTDAVLSRLPADAHSLLEPTMDAMPELWLRRNYTVLLSEGLFEHSDPTKYGRRPPVRSVACAPQE